METRLSVIPSRFRGRSVVRVVLPLLFLLAVGLTASAQDRTERAPRGGVQPTMHKVADLRPLVKKERLKEGLNLLAERKGIKFYCEVKNGKVVGFPAMDDQGRKLKGTDHRTREAGKIVCWKCHEDSNGVMHCVMIPCPDVFGSLTIEGSGDR